jgi:superfamily II DNA or RNA helicase
MITLRPDQEDVRTKLRLALRSHGSVLCYAPTGFGKTVLAAALIKLIAGAGKRVIFCVHRVDLITQTAKTFEKFDIPFSYIAAGYSYNPNHRVFIASIATLKNRLGKIPADYVLVDEAHLSVASGWKSVADHYRETGSRLIGLTGSPERLDGKPLGDVWGTMVMGPSVRWLIEQGHLSRYRAFAPAGVDLSKVHTRNGDYVASEIDDLMSGKAVLSNAVQHWRKFAGGKRTIAFAPSVNRSEQLAAEFRANGINAVALDGGTPHLERRATFIGFADRQIELIVNCQLFCEGFDLAAQVDRDVTIEAVLDYAPTQSLARHLQKHGRGLRRDDGGEHILLDLVGGFGRLGLPDEDREWSLDGKKKDEDQKEKGVTCPNCYAFHEPAPKCPVCEHSYAHDRIARGGRETKEVEGELEEIDIEAVRAAKKQEQRSANTLDDLVKLAVARGYKKPEKWAAYIWSYRQAKSAERFGAR